MDLASATFNELLATVPRENQDLMPKALYGFPSLNKCDIMEVVVTQSVFARRRHEGCSDQWTRSGRDD